MTAGVSANKLELLQIADAVAREKGIEPSVVLSAMEEAITRAAKARYGLENDIRAKIDSETGDTKLLRIVTVVEQVEDDNKEISLTFARQTNADAQLGDEIEDELPPIEFGRIATQAAKQVITQRVREAEREQQYQEFKDRVGEVISGIVKRVEYGNVVIDLGRGEAVIRRNQLIPREVFRNGDRIRAYIQDVRREQRGSQIILSRNAPDFMAKLFTQEVPEIYDGIIEIKGVVRDPGSRAKIAVTTNDPSIDPVGACVGVRGSRVQAVSGELQGEKVDIVQWSSDPAGFVVNALSHAAVTKVVLDEDAGRIEMVVPDEEQSLAIGRRGQNVRLASQLTGWDIDILTEEEESERRQAEFASRTELFMEALDVDEMIAQLLASEGFATVEEIAYVPLDEITMIEGFDEETAEEIQSRAQDHLDQQNEIYDAQRKEMGVADALAELEGLTPAMLVALGESDIKTLEDFAGCVTDDLLGWYEYVDGKKQHQKGVLHDYDLSADEAEYLIMKARLQAGWISQDDLDALKNTEEETQDLVDDVFGDTIAETSEPETQEPKSEQKEDVSDSGETNP